MISTVYGWLGMDFALKLSTKPETALGDPEVWEVRPAHIVLNYIPAKCTRVMKDTIHM